MDIAQFGMSYWDFGLALSGPLVAIVSSYWAIGLAVDAIDVGVAWIRKGDK